MLQLANAELTVDLLDPAAEHARLGPRFCWGGYIWQVHDHAIGALLTGPEWPNPAPAPHNGQGLPESFRHSTTEGRPLLWEDSTGLAPGSGRLTRDAAGNVVVVEPCVWRIERGATRVVFRTEQTVGAWSYALERTIELDGRQLRSTSRLTNRGTTPLRLEWFAHPFFALGPDGKSAVTLPVGTTLVNNPGYELSGRTLRFKRAFVGLHDGHLEHLQLRVSEPFAIEIAHPKIAGIRFRADIVPFKCVLWANGHTVSVEPFLALALAPGEAREWTLTYDFGSATSGCPADAPQPKVRTTANEPRSGVRYRAGFDGYQSRCVIRLIRLNPFYPW